MEVDSFNKKIVHVIKCKMARFCESVRNMMWERMLMSHRNGDMRICMRLGKRREV